MEETTYLPALFALSLLGSPVDPVVGRLGLLPVLSYADVSEGRFALQLSSFHQHRDAAGVGDDFARRALHPGTVFLCGKKKRGRMGAVVNRKSRCKVR